MPELKLFVAPASCARVATIALEEIGVPFETELVRTGINQQKSPEYLKINPRGKVPALLIDGKPLTENVAILSWLHRTFPEARLLPEPAGDMDVFLQMGDISFFSATVHPIVTRIAMPVKFIDDGPLSFDIVRPAGIAAMKPVMQIVEDRLEGQDWWYGDTWSIVDAYLFWAWWRITGVGFPGEEFPNILAHAARIVERPAVQRAMAREDVNIEVLKSEGIYKAPK